MDDSVAQFTSITGCEAERAKFFLDAAGGDVEVAVANYFESGGDAATAGTPAADDDDDDEPVASAAPAPAASSTGPRTLSGAPAEPMPEGWGRPAASAAPARSGAGGFSAGGGRGGIATFRDLAAAQGSGSGGPSGPAGDDSDDESDDGRDPANFYAGGERSGLNVVNPNRGARGPQPDVVADILRQAQEAGARGPDPEEEGTLSRTGGTGPSFSGRGRTIGQEAEEEDELAGAEEEEAPVTEETVIRHLTFWQDGFSVEDGPLMRYDDPAHAQTLAQINNGRAPLALLGVRFGQPVELRVARRTDEKYTPPPPAPMKPFGGSGQRLGSPAPTPSSSAQPAAAPATRAPNPTNVAFEIDDAQPTTTLQIRLIDGQRVSARFNTSHTVADIRRWIDASHPNPSRSYVLQASFPPKPIADETQSIQAAGLAGSVVIQKGT